MKRKVHLIEFFEDTATRLPDKTALKAQDLAFSFQTVRSRAKTVAWHIEQLGAYQNRPVAIYLNESWQAVVSIFGILYSGNCYAPLDVQNPLERTRKILQRLDPCCIITDSKGRDSLRHSGNQVPVIDFEEIDFCRLHGEPIGYRACIDTDPAYIIHTSGSTGLPKGVVISHLGVMDYISWAIETFDISDKEVIGNQAPLVFDNSTLDLYLMAFAGATLCLIPKQLYMFPAKLMDYIRANGINFVFWVPSVLVSVANLKILDEIKVPNLRKVLFAGEVMPTKQLNYWKNRMDHDVLFANLYGPTEITVDCTYHIPDRTYTDDEVLPIGKPCRNSDVLILNDKNQLSQMNEQGELCVRGSSLALGYWNDPEKTAAAFVHNPLNPYYPEKIYRTGDMVYRNEAGEIILMGRKDIQIKHLGYRIELGEIEHVISNTFGDIIPCVLYDEPHKRIVLVYQAQEDIPPVEFRKSLSQRLSKYMIPGEYIRMERLPHNASGKIDRNLLKTLLREAHTSSV